jgi:hypothetical protein
MAKKQRYYFIDTHSATEKFALVEKATNVVTEDGYTSNYQSISESSLQISVRGIYTDSDITADSLSSNAFTNIPSRFHEYLASKVIAIGYKDPRKLDLQAAQYFDMEYDKGIKKGRKTARSNYSTTGNIVPQDF